MTQTCTTPGLARGAGPPQSPRRPVLARPCPVSEARLQCAESVRLHASQSGRGTVNSASEPNAQWGREREREVED